MEFLCGAAREKITPPLGTLLYGYRPDVVSTSVHDDLTATAVSFSDGKNTMLLISATLGDIDTKLDTELRQKMSEKCGVPAENIILAATHTHSAPNVSGVEGWGDIDRKYVDTILLPALLKASSDAVSGMLPAELGTAVGNSDIGINRRQHNRGGWVSLGQNQWGCYDPNMTAVIIRKKSDHKGIINLIHYGCHGTACGISGEITRDWSGMMIDRVEKETGTLTTFINGAIGDVGPRLSNGLTVGDITHVEELGSYAALDAMRIVRQVKGFSVPEITIKHGNVRLPYQKHPPLDEIKSELEKTGDPSKLINIDYLRYKHLTAVKELMESGNDRVPDDFTYPVITAVIGDIAFLPFPFEIFSGISMRLRAYSGYQNTLCLTCANGYNAYLPTEDQLCLGGYEVGVFRYASVYSLADNTDENIINETLKILES